jgi:hypothetical protein
VVSAMTAEIDVYSVDVKNGAGHTVRVLRGQLRDPAEKHGVNLDEADSLLEEAGYVMGRPVWREEGKFYKAVVVPEASVRRVGPVYSDESMAAWRASPEGERHAAAMRKHRG